MYPLSSIPPAKDPYMPHELPHVAWNPWADVRKRDDVSKLNTSFPFGGLPNKFQVSGFNSLYF